LSVYSTDPPRAVAWQQISATAIGTGGHWENDGLLLQTGPHRSVRSNCLRVLSSALSIDRANKSRGITLAESAKKLRGVHLFR
jgi:hypothetical protein